MTTLQIVFLALPTGLILLWLILAARGPRKIEVPSVIAVLRYGPALRTLTLAMALVTAMIMIYVIAVFPAGTDNRVAIRGGSLLALCLIAGVAYIEVCRTHVYISEDGITRISPWKRRVTLNWSAVESVRYSRLNSVFVVTAAGRTIRVSRYLSGIKIFVGTVKRKLATERFRTAATALDAIR